mgnify:CR=1 FL=1
MKLCLPKMPATVPTPAPVKITNACSPARNNAICITDRPTARSIPSSMKRRRNETMAYTRKPSTVNAAAANGPHVDLNMQELRLVEFLGNEGPRMMRELAEYIAVAVNSVTSIVDGLENKGLVQRHRSEQDRRVIRVDLTDSGREMYTSLVEVNLRLFRSMLGALSDEEQETFMVLFRKIARAGRSQVTAGTR